MKPTDLFNTIKRLAIFQADPICGSRHRLFNTNTSLIMGTIKFFNQNKESLLQQFTAQPFDANACPKNYAQGVNLPSLLSAQDQSAIRKEFAEILEASIPKNKVDAGSNCR